jgi:hypothetical protein
MKLSDSSILAIPQDVAAIKEALKSVPRKSCPRVTEAMDAAFRKLTRENWCELRVPGATTLESKINCEIDALRALYVPDVVVICFYLPH